MKKFTLTLALSLFCFNAYAAENIDKELALEYLKISRYEDVVNASIKQYETQILREATPEVKAEIHNVFVNTLGWDATKDQLATLVMNIYTKQEIQASIAFMKSPEGASATAKSEEFSKQFTALLAGNLQKVLATCCAQKK